MEYVPDGTLVDRISTAGLDRETLATIALDLLSALDAVHRNGVLHRDVKPANVLLDGDGRVRLTDFGIAHLGDRDQLALPGQMVGTVRYLAPELVDTGVPSERSDLYALGVLLREAAGDELADATLRLLIGRLVDPDPERRPASAAEARTWLEAALSADPPTETFTAPPPRPLHRELAAIRRARVPRAPLRVLAAGSAIVATVVVLTMSSGSGSHTPSASRTTVTTVLMPEPGSHASLQTRLSDLSKDVKAATRR